MFGKEHEAYDESVAQPTFWGKAGCSPTPMIDDQRCASGIGLPLEPLTGDDIGETAQKKDACQDEEEQIEHGARLLRTPGIHRVRSCAHTYSASEIKRALKDGSKA